MAAARQCLRGLRAAPGSGPQSHRFPAPYSPQQDSKELNFERVNAHLDVWHGFLYRVVTLSNLRADVGTPPGPNCCCWVALLSYRP
eukprot:1039361-Amphidinium_carterae.1